MADKHEDQAAAGDAAGAPHGVGAADEEHAEMRAALDEIEEALDEAAATITRMA